MRTSLGREQLTAQAQQPARSLPPPQLGPRNRLPRRLTAPDTTESTQMPKINPRLRTVVKVGSSSISGENESQLLPLVTELSRLHAAGGEITLVSSGAISTGVPVMRLTERPTDLATQQAAAAVGQYLLVSKYQNELTKHDIVGAQVLLTASDFESADHKENAKRALHRLLELRALPIVNENDTVATHEIRFGDNDRLAALVARLLRADQLILLSDVDALYTAPPQEPGAKRIPFVPFGDELSDIKIGEAKSGWGTGGALTKVAAARLAAAAGVRVVLTNTQLFGSLLDGEDVGTWFAPSTEPVSL